MDSRIRLLLIVTASLLCVVASGCSDDPTQRLYADLISGEEMVFELIEKDGWVIYSGNEGRTIILSKGDSPVIYVTDRNGEREITIHSSPTVFGAVTVKDEDLDGVYDQIKYRSERVEVSDILMDGEIDSILDYDKQTMRVNYQGLLYELLGEGNEKYIVVDTERVNLKHENYQFVPVEKPTPNKALNADP